MAQDIEPYREIVGEPVFNGEAWYYLGGFAMLRPEPSVFRSFAHAEWRVPNHHRRPPEPFRLPTWAKAVTVSIACAGACLVSPLLGLGSDAAFVLGLPVGSVGWLVFDWWRS